MRVGKAIYNILSKDAGITEKVQNKIYPLVADVDTTFPFIIYKRTAINPSSSKDRFIYSEEVQVDIVVASDKYDESIDIAELIKDALSKGSYDGIKDISFIDADEDFIQDTFIQRLTFKIRK